MSIDPLMAQHTMALTSAQSLQETPASEAGTAFEGMMIEMMIREMRKTLPEDGFLNNKAIDIFSGMLDQELAKQISANGGFGLGASLDQHIQRNPTDLQDALQMLRPPEAAPRTGFRVRWPVQGRITSRFGHRNNPFGGGHEHHRGLDIAAVRGTPIKPIGKGTVAFAGQRPHGGNVVVIDHGNGWTSTYAHCDSINVRVGQRVRANEQIATVGATGRATGNHLHLGVHHNGELVDPLDVLPGQH